jgi:hypothetical protein
MQAHSLGATAMAYILGIIMDRFARALWDFRPDRSIAPQELGDDLDSHVIGSCVPEISLFSGAPEGRSYSIHDHNVSGFQFDPFLDHIRALFPFCESKKSSAL